MYSWHDKMNMALDLYDLPHTTTPVLSWKNFTQISIEGYLQDARPTLLKTAEDRTSLVGQW